MRQAVEQAARRGIRKGQAMGSLVKLNIHEGVARITIEAPPVNAQSLPVRRGLWEAVSIAEADPKVLGLAILGANGIFSAGADIAEFEGDPRDPWFGTLFNRIEDCEKPVVAGIAGAALGGGLELALACHFRLAAPGAQLGLPEVTLGLLPGGGGTQRAPRLIGAEAALRLMTTGAPMGARTAETIGLVDGVVSDDVAGAAISLARELGQAGGTGGPRRTRDLRDGMTDAAGYAAAVARAREALAADPARARLEAPHRVIDCVESAILLPFETGLAYEAEAFDELRQGRQSAALRHMFLSERRVARPERLGGAKAAQPKSIGVVGGGPRGTALTIAAARAGLDVRLMEQDVEHIEAARDRVWAHFHAEAGAGRMTVEAAEAATARVTGADGDAGLMDCDIVIESMPDESGLKPDLLASLSELLGEDTPLATTARSPALEDLARPVSHPQALIALRFAGPAHEAGLVELGTLPETGAQTLAVGFALAKALGVTAICSEPPVGPLVEAAGLAAAEEVLAAGEASEAEINGAFVMAGFGTVPHEGAGTAVLPDWKAEELIRPVLLAMVNTGALLMAQGAVENAAAIDVVMVAGHGFPRHLGGPMHWADAEGLLAVQKELNARSERFGPGLWEPAPQFDDLIKNGLGFGSL